MSADEEENSEATENTPTFQEFDDQPFDEEQIPNATQKQKSALQSEKPKRAKNSTVEEKHLSILNRTNKELKKQSETKETQDEDYFYGQTVAASIRKLRNMDKCMIKHEINKILFKYQMSMCKAQNTGSTSQRIAYPTPPTPTRFSAVTSNDFNWQHTHAPNFSQASPHGYSSVKWGLLARNEVGLFQICDHVKTIKNH